MLRNKRSWFILGGIVLLIIIFLVVAYNSLVGKEENVKKQWAEVQNTYQRRLDLIPNLVSVVRGVANFEQTTLVKITELRSQAAGIMVNDSISGQNYDQQARVHDSLSVQLNRLLVQVEAYPELKATTAFSRLQTQLEGTERRINIARRDFNDAVNLYNSKLRSFPTNLVSGLLGFKRMEGFEAEAGAEKNVEVDFK